MDDNKLDKVIHGLKVVGGYLDMKSYTDNIAFNLIPRIKDALELLQEQEETIKQKDKEIEEWIEAYNFEH